MWVDSSILFLAAAAGLGGAISGFITGSFLPPWLRRSTTTNHLGQGLKTLGASVFGHAAIGGSSVIATRWLPDASRSLVWGGYLAGAFVGFTAGVLVSWRHEAGRLKVKSVADSAKLLHQKSRDKIELQRLRIVELPKILRCIDGLPHDLALRVLDIVNQNPLQDEEDEEVINEIADLIAACLKESDSSPSLTRVDDFSAEDETE